MVNFALPALVLVALTPIIGAVAVPAESSVTNTVVQDQVVEERFSFAKWVDDIIANKTTLSPEQAYEAYERTVLNATEPSGTLNKRVPRCNNIPHGRVLASDAVKCINYLASLGATPCVVRVSVRFAQCGNAEMWGVGRGSNAYSSRCEHVARAGGLIMDACTEPDNTVQGDEYAWGNGDIAVHIVKKGIF